MTRTVVGGVGLVATLLLGCLHAPILWSPDGKWVAYTVASPGGGASPARGWIFPDRATRAGTPRGGAATYRLWATRAATGESVLLEEARGPLTSPAWSPDGRALAFGRIVAEGDGRARFEVVVREAPDRRRVLASRPIREIHDRAAELPRVSPAWSPDGHHLAVPSFQQDLGLAILRADNGRILKVVEEAYLPSWSPDGKALAFVRGGDVETLHLLDSDFGAPRQLAVLGEACQAPTWSRDGQSLLAVARRPGPPSQQVELLRIAADTGRVDRLAHLAPEPIGRDRTFYGASFCADRDEEVYFYTSAVEGQPSEIFWFFPRTGETFKRFHPVDPSIPVGALAVSPDGKTLAMRMGGPGRVMPPALYDLEAGRLDPLIPDDSARVEWISLLAGTALDLLRAGLPKVDGVGGAAGRPTVLPIPGEFAPGQRTASRLRRIAKLARPLCDRPGGMAPASPDVEATLDEARLFFDYLREDYPAAMTALEKLEGRSGSPEERLRLLGLRAQILMGQGETDRAAETIAFLRAALRPAPRGVEMTPAGPVLTAEADRDLAWCSYLAARAEDWRRDGQDASRPREMPLSELNLDAPPPGFGPDLREEPVLIAPPPLEELVPEVGGDEPVEPAPRVRLRPPGPR